jgi:translocation and assembly module TamA
MCLSLPVLLCLATGISAIAEPLRYDLKLGKTGVTALDDTLNDVSLLVSLHDAPPDSIFALVDRARSDNDRVRTALESFGYYHAALTIQVAGRDIGDLDAFTTMNQPPDGAIPVDVTIDKGPLYHLRAITIDGTLPAGMAAALDLHQGDPAVAAAVLAGRDRLQWALRREGYAFAKIDDPIADADDDAHVLDVSFAVHPGDKAKIGSLSFPGAKTLNEDFLHRVAAVEKDELYTPDAVDRARRNLLALDVFSAVSVRDPDKPADDGTAPLTIDVTEKKPHSVSLSANYSTDLGTSVAVTWLHRNLFGKAEQLALAASATGLGGNAVDGLGYDLSARLTKPCIWGCGRTLELTLAAVKQNLDAYDQTAESIGAAVGGPLTPFWTVHAGLKLTYDETQQYGTNRRYQLFALPLGATYDDTGAGLALNDPLRGYRVSLSLTPVVSVGTKDLIFAQLQASGSAYFDLFGDGRSVLALRALVGSMQGASSSDLPPDQRFYAGGSVTVRGFRYQSIGPTFSGGEAAGAASVDAVSVEWRQRVYGDFGVAGFIDMGQAGSSSLPFDGTLAIGAGGGLRYYTPIGAVRLDIGVPLTTVPRNDTFQIYLSLGQAF